MKGHVAFATLALAGCAHQQYLGANVAEACEDNDAEGCLGWVMERDLLAAELAIYDNAKLRDYVQSVADRLAASSSLTAGRAPRVVIADHDETYATAGRRIVIARSTIELLSSEAELAGILAHELAHIEARHVIASVFGRPPEDSQADRRDAELVADERAVALLEKSGYAPVAMARALAAVLVEEGESLVDDEGDADHPPASLRVARVAKLAGGRTGFEGRDEFLLAIDEMIVGVDPRLGHRLVVTDTGTDAWVVPALGIAFDLGPDDDVSSANRTLITDQEHSRLAAYAVGAPWGKELAASLDSRRVIETELGTITLGVVAPPAADDASPFDKLARSIRATLPQPPAGMRVAIVERPAGALIVEVAGTKLPTLKLRAATDLESALAEPARLQLVKAPSSGFVGQLGICQGRLLDDAMREVNRGDFVKCADRVAPPTVVAIKNDLDAADEPGGSIEIHLVGR